MLPKSITIIGIDYIAYEQVSMNETKIISMAI